MIKSMEEEMNLRMKQSIVFALLLFLFLAADKAIAQEAKDHIFPVPQDNVGIKKMKFTGINGQRYTEIFLIGGNVATRELKGGVYQTIGLNDPEGKGDTAPAAILDKMDMKGLAKEYSLPMTYKNGPRLWTLDWLEVAVGKQRNFQGLDARWVMWLDVPKKLGGPQKEMAYKAIHGKRDSLMGINKGTRVYLLDDPEGNTYCMKSASQILFPDQTYESLKDLGKTLKPAPGWKFRTKVLEKDLVFTPDNGKAIICQDDFGNTYDRVGGPFSNYKP